MPSKMWDTPFDYDKGNKEFPDAETAKQMPACLYEKEMPTGSTPIDTPIASMKVKENVGPGEYAAEEISTSYNESEWDTPYADRYKIGRTEPTH